MQDQNSDCTVLNYYAVKKVFVKFLRSFSKFFKVFASVLRFSRAFRGFRIQSDPLGCIRMHSEAIGSVWTFSNFFLRFFGFLSRFSTFPDVIFTKDFFHGTILIELRLCGIICSALAGFIHG